MYVYTYEGSSWMPFGRPPPPRDALFRFVCAAFALGRFGCLLFASEVWGWGRYKCLYTNVYKYITEEYITASEACAIAEHISTHLFLSVWPFPAYPKHIDYLNKCIPLVKCTFAQVHFDQVYLIL